MKLRIAEALWARLANELLRRDDVETAGLLLAERLETADGGVVFRVTDTVVVPDDGYQVRRRDQLRIDPVALNRLVRPARDRGLSVFTVHTHPGGSEPWFSWADDHGDRRLMPSFDAQLDGPHGSLVLVPTRRALARAWVRDDFATLPFRVVGARVTSPSADVVEAHAEVFARQVLALGSAGQERLRRSRVGVVGFGGTGSPAAIQLAHLGVGEIVVMDGDDLEHPNRSRILGSRASDVGSPKVDVFARYVEESGLPVKVRTVHAYLRGEAELRELRGCDVVLSCVDRHSPRALLNRLAYEALVPVIDMGTAFRVDGRGKLIGDAGRVVVVGPGRPCLACWGHIDPGALRVEALAEEDLRRETAEGYVSGARVEQPSVVAFNTMVAGAAVVELLRLLAGFDEDGDPVLRLAFAFRDGTVRRNVLGGEGRDLCRLCGQA